MIRLSQIAKDPTVAAFLSRGEKDSGNAYAVPPSPPPAPVQPARLAVAYA